MKKTDKGTLYGILGFVFSFLFKFVPKFDVFGVSGFLQVASCALLSFSLYKYCSYFRNWCNKQGDKNMGIYALFLTALAAIILIALGRCEKNILTQIIIWTVECLFGIVLGAVISISDELESREI